MKTLDKNLLAFSIALQEIKGHKSDLRKLSRKIYLEPDDVQGIQSQLNEILRKNESLNRAYAVAQKQLENAGKDFVENLPSSSEIKRFDSQQKELVANRGFPPGKPDAKTQEISNIVVTILASEKPSETSKTLLQKLCDFLKSISNQEDEKS